MKFCVIGPTYPYRGGLAHYTTFLVRNLRRSHEVAFYSYRRQYPKLLFPGNTAPDPSRHALQEECERTIDMLNPLTWWRTASAVISERPDVLLLQWWTPFWLPLLLVVASAARRARVPIVYLCHQFAEPDSPPWEWYLARPALTTADGLIVVSRREETLARQTFPGKPIRRGHLPVYDGFPTQGLTRSEARRALDIAADVPLLLFFGFVRRYKGLRLLIEALAQVPFPIRLLVAGEFWEDERLYRDLIERYDLLDRVTIHNRYVPNEHIEPYFVAADALVLPYLSGNQSGVGMLAHHFCLPVIATDVGGLADTVVHEQTGLVVPTNDSRSLADAIQRYFSADLRLVFQPRIAEMRERFSWDELVRIIEDLSREVIERRGRSASSAEIG